MQRRTLDYRLLCKKLPGQKVKKYKLIISGRKTSFVKENKAASEEAQIPSGYGQVTEHESLTFLFPTEGEQTPE